MLFAQWKTTRKLADSVVARCIRHAFAPPGGSVKQFGCRAPGVFGAGRSIHLNDLYQISSEEVLSTPKSKKIIGMACWHAQVAWSYIWMRWIRHMHLNVSWLRWLSVDGGASTYWSDLLLNNIVVRLECFLVKLTCVRKPKTTTKQNKNRFCAWRTYCTVWSWWHSGQTMWDLCISPSFVYFYSAPFTVFCTMGDASQPNLLYALQLPQFSTNTWAEACSHFRAGPPTWNEGANRWGQKQIIRAHLSSQVFSMKVAMENPWKIHGQSTFLIIFFDCFKEMVRDLRDCRPVTHHGGFPALVQAGNALETSLFHHDQQLYEHVNLIEFSWS